MCEFKIQELALLNYRRFENEKFTLNPRMNVFAGKNGSGKTTVLEAANVMLGAYLAQAASARARCWEHIWQPIKHTFRPGLYTI